MGSSECSTKAYVVSVGMITAELRITHHVLVIIPHPTDKIVCNKPGVTYS